VIASDHSVWKIPRLRLLILEVRGVGLVEREPTKLGSHETDFTVPSAESDSAGRRVRRASPGSCAVHTIPKFHGSS